MSLALHIATRLPLGHRRVMALSLALIEPEIAGNTGAILRTAACFGAAVHIIEPCGFAFGDRALKRAGMDYATALAPVRHANRAAFVAAMHAAGRRLLLLTSHGATSLYAHRFQSGDVLMLGNEGSGAPADMHDAADHRLLIPMEPGFRSLNVSVAAGIALAEARRQLLERQS
jgi:tRNA (cytidine/uridine-2'-O-)-methyltransferase